MSTHDSAEDAPTFTELQGVYYSDESVDKTVLILASDADFNENHVHGAPFGQYVLIVRDSLQNEKIQRGFWDYIAPTDKSSDYSIGPDGYSAIEFTPFANRKIFLNGLAHFGVKENQKRLFIDCQNLINESTSENRYNEKHSLNFEKRAFYKRYRP
ncbi:MAG: hypothetical protein ABI778_05765 [Ignavibacteriota bacterium]